MQTRRGGVGSRAPRRACCRAAADPRGRLDLDLASFGNCRWHVESVLPADVVRCAVAHDQVDVALHDVELEGGHLESILTLVFRDELHARGESIRGPVLVERKSYARLPCRNLRVLVLVAVVVDVGKVAHVEHEPHEGGMILREGRPVGVEDDHAIESAGLENVCARELRLGERHDSQRPGCAREACLQHARLLALALHLLLQGGCHGETLGATNNLGAKVRRLSVSTKSNHL